MSFLLRTALQLYWAHSVKSSPQVCLWGPLISTLPRLHLLPGLSFTSQSLAPSSFMAVLQTPFSLESSSFSFSFEMRSHSVVTVLWISLSLQTSFNSGQPSSLRFSSAEISSVSQHTRVFPLLSGFIFNHLPLREAVSTFRKIFSLTRF